MVKNHSIEKESLSKERDETDLDKLIIAQSSEGFWQDSSILSSIPSSIKAKLQSELPSKDIRVLITLVALWILQDKYEDLEGMWQMIAKKAKTWLKKQGIPKVEPFIKKIREAC